MPSFIHLNGPPGIGKSTISALYADRHPGTLNLDIDRLHWLVGGWQDRATRMHDILRPMALVMAATHLADGRDVILPQYLGQIGEIERFEGVAHDGGAEFREYVLIDHRHRSISRFDDRVDDSAWGRHNRRNVAAQGGPAFLGEMYDRLSDVLQLRPAAVSLPSEAGAVEATYASLIEALSRPDTRTGSGHTGGPRDRVEH